MKSHHSTPFVDLPSRGLPLPLLEGAVWTFSARCEGVAGENRKGDSQTGGERQSQPR